MSPKDGLRRWWARPVVRLGALGFGLYVGVLLLIWSLERRLIFPGAGDPSWMDPPRLLNVQDVSLQLSDETRIHAWWLPVEGTAKGAILYSHGNGGNLSHRAGLIARWRHELGLPVMIFDYPGYGKSEGQPSEQTCIAAAEAAYQWLIEQQHLSGSEIVLLGSSLGGGVALDLAARLPFRMVICCSTFTSIPDMAQRQFPWLPARWLVRTRFDNRARLRDVPGPVFFAHGSADTLIPMQMSQTLHDLAREPRRLYIEPGLGHVQPESPQFFEAVRAFLRDTRTK